MEELKPCPFCGGEAEFMATVEFGVSHERDMGYVRCKKCLAAFDYVQIRHKAIASWNRRAAPENDYAALKAKYDEINRYNISCTKKIDELLVEKVAAPENNEEE